jgi:hypothetical protein
MFNTLYDFLILSPFTLEKGEWGLPVKFYFKTFQICASTTRLRSASTIRLANQPTIAPADNHTMKFTKFI